MGLNRWHMLRHTASHQASAVWRIKGRLSGRIPPLQIRLLSSSAVDNSPRGKAGTCDTSCEQQLPKPCALPNPLEPTLNTALGNQLGLPNPSSRTHMLQTHTYRSNGLSSFPELGPCPLLSSSWSPPGLSACQTCLQGHPSLCCREAQ